VLASIGCRQVLGLDDLAGRASMHADSQGPDVQDRDANNPDGPAYTAPPCSVTDSRTVLCLELDDPNLTTALDSSASHHHVAIHNVTVATRDVPIMSQAAQIGPASTIDVSDGADFDTQEFTLTAWVHREATPGTGELYAVVDVLDEYGMDIATGGDVQCAISDGTTTYALQGVGATTLNGWDLITCSSGAGQYCIGRFPNGKGPGVVGCNSETRPVNTAGQGANVGSLIVAGNATSALVGKLDSVRVLSRFLTPKQVCLEAGLSGC
jgi:hypothetical protein